MSKSSIVPGPPPSTNRFYYDSSGIGIPMIAEVKEIFRYRDLLYLLVTNRLKTRYRRSILGVLWTLLNPLLTMTVLTIAFSTVVKFSIKNYPVYLLSGLIFWNFFSQATISGMNSIIWGGSLLRRIYIPRTIFSLSAIGSELLNLIVSLLPLFLIMFIQGHPFKPALLFLPVAIIIMTLFALGIALFISTIGIYFFDWPHFYQVIIMALFYLTPIIYPEGIIPETYARFTQFNPLGYLLSLFRDPIFLGRFPASEVIFNSLFSALVAFFSGWWVFTRAAKEFAYRV